MENMREPGKKKVQLAITMALFGTIGTFTRFIDMPSGIMCCVRALIASALILAYLYLAGRKPDMKALKSEIGTLAAAGIMLGLDWFFIFEGFRRTTVAVASVCFYTEPVFLMVAAAVFFREKLTRVKIICVFTALAGTALISGLFGGQSGAVGLSGVICSLIAAVFYAGNVLLNRRLRAVKPVDATAAQLVIGGLVILPYSLLTLRSAEMSFTPLSIALLLILAVVHTGLGYIMYYDSAAALSAGTIAVLSYVDPLVSVLLSVLFLREPMTAAVFAGIVLIFGAAFMSEAADRR